MEGIKYDKETNNVISKRLHASQIFAIMMLLGFDKEDGYFINSEFSNHLI